MQFLMIEKFDPSLRGKTIRKLVFFWFLFILPIFLVAGWLAWSALWGNYSAQAAQGINQQINYQGKIANSSGVSLITGLYNFKFAIYDDPTGGTRLWQEIWTATSTAGTVTINNGVFSVALGTSTSLSTVDFNNNSLWLQVSHDSDSDGIFEETFTPRKKLSSTPYAFNADTVDGIHASTTATANQILALDAQKGLNLNSVTTTGTINAGSYVTSTGGFFSQGNLWIGGNASSSHFAADEICLNGDCQTSWAGGVPGVWATTSERNFWNTTSTWAGFEGQFNTFLNATSTLDLTSFVSNSITTTDSFYAGGYVSSTGGFFTQGNSHIGGTLSVDGTVSGTGFTTLQQNFWNSTTSWSAYDTNWNRNYDATTTLNGFSPANYFALSAWYTTTTWAGGAQNLNVTGYASSTNGVNTQGDGHIGGNLTVDGSLAVGAVDPNVTLDSGDIYASLLRFNATSTIYSSEFDLSFQDENTGIKTLSELVAGPSGCNDANTLISGGLVTYSTTTGAGFIYDVQSTTYCIAGVQYSVPASQVTLSLADPLGDRIDIVAVNTASAAVVITGATSTNPIAPSLDPMTQFSLTFVYIKAGAVLPGVDGGGPVTDNIYLENVEWASSQTTPIGEVDFDSVVDPKNGTKNIEVTTALKNGDYFQFATSSAYWDQTGFNTISFYIKNKTAWANTNDRLNVAFRTTTGTAIGSTISIRHNTYGFDKNNTSAYQKIAIPLSSFGTLGTSAKYIRFTASIGSAVRSLNFRMDDIMAQGPSASVTSTPTSITGTGAANQVAFWTGTLTLAGSNSFVWDSSLSSLGIGTTTPGSWYGEKLNVVGGSLFTGGVTTTNDIWSQGRVTSTAGLFTQGNAHIGGTLSVDGTVSGTGFTTLQQNFWNSTTSWSAYDTNWARNYDATTTLSGFTPANYLLGSDYYATTTWAGGAQNLNVTGYASTTNGLYTQGNSHIGGTFSVDGTVSGTGFTTLQQNFWNGTTSWAAYDTNWNRNYDATTTLNGFSPSNYFALSAWYATTTWAGGNNLVVSTTTATSTFAGDVQIADGKDLQVSTIYGYSPININAPLIISGAVTTTGRMVLGSTNPINNFGQLWVGGDVFINGNATSSHLSADEICLNGDCQTAWPVGGPGGDIAQLGIIGDVNTTSLSYGSILVRNTATNKWDASTTWPFYDTNWDRNLSATTTWAGFAGQFNTYLNATTTLDLTSFVSNSITTTDTFYAGGYASTTGGLYTQGNSHIGGTFSVDGVVSGTGFTTLQQNFWNGTTSWAAYDTNWNRNYNATSTLNGFTPANYFALSAWYATTTWAGGNNLVVSTTTATSTFAGGLSVGSGSLRYDWSSGVTSIDNLEMGAMSFDTDAGIVSWIDFPVSDVPAAGTVESYSAQIDGSALLTVYSEADSAGGIQRPSIGVATTTPGGYFGEKLTVAGNSYLLGSATSTGTVDAAQYCISGTNCLTAWPSGSDVAQLGMIVDVNTTTLVYGSLLAWDTSEWVSTTTWSEFETQFAQFYNATTTLNGFSASGVAMGDTIGNSPVDGSVLFVGTSGILEQDNANFFWDNTSKFLGIGLAAPIAQLQLDIAAGGQNLFLSNDYGAVGRTSSIVFGSTVDAVAYNRIDSVIEAASTVGLHFFTTADSKATFNEFSMTGGGNLGIGLAAPAQKIEIGGGNIILGRTANATAYYIGTGGSDGAITPGSSGGAQIAFASLGATDDDVIQFLTHDYGVTHAVRMTINGIGDVQLNTAGASILDASANQSLTFISTASAVNELTLTNGATGGAVDLSATGDDTDINLSLTPKGAGLLVSSANLKFSNATPIIFDTSGNELLKFVDTASAVNEFTITSAATTGYVDLSATGGDTDIGITLTPKGAGTVGIGTAAPTQRLQVAGGALCVGSDVNCSGVGNGEGDIYAANGYITSYADVAERYPTKDSTLQPAEIVSLDIDNEVFVERGSLDSVKIFGVISTHPGFTLGAFNDDKYKDEQKVLIALSGRVPVKVNDHAGPIAIGDRITISDEPGIGQRASYGQATVGIALESFDGSLKTTSTIMMFVENGYELDVAKIDVAGAEDNGSTSSGLGGFILSFFEKLGVRISQGIAYFKSLVAEDLTVGNENKPTAITIYDKNGQPGCMTVDDVNVGAFHVVPGICGAQETVTTNPVVDDSTPPEPTADTNGNNVDQEAAPETAPTVDENISANSASPESIADTDTDSSDDASVPEISPVVDENITSESTPADGGISTVDATVNP